MTMSTANPCIRAPSWSAGLDGEIKELRESIKYASMVGELEEELEEEV